VKVKEFRSVGQPEGAVQAVTSVVGELSTIVQDDLPETPVKHDIQKYIKSLNEAMMGVGEGVDLLNEGESVEGVEAVSAGLKGAIDELVPEAERTSRTYSAIIAQTDPEISEIVKAILQQQSHIINTKVCWKRHMKRDRISPQECDAGYTLTAYGCLNATGAVHEPRCPAGAEGRGRWCYWYCPSGYTSRNLHCRQDCKGVWRTESRLMCGRYRGSVRNAIWEMMVGSVRSIFRGDDLKRKVMHAGIVLAAGLRGTMGVFAEATKPFDYPMCPEHFPGKKGSR